MKTKKKMRKITVVLPEEILMQALESSGGGIASTIKKGLELLVAKVAYKKLLALRGKVKTSINLRQLRED